jgi:hypothetical protein
VARLSTTTEHHDARGTFGLVSAVIGFVNRREAKVKIVSGLFGAAVLAGLAFAAYAQGLPPGSYQQSCRDFRMQGGTLTALCKRANGRGDQLTALNVTHCVGDIGNNDGQLVCNGGRPATPTPPPAREAQRGYAPGYPAPGYGPPPRYGEEGGYRERCEGLRHEEHELRDRLAYTPYGEERERLQYRLGRVRAEREQCWRR